MLRSLPSLNIAKMPQGETGSAVSINDPNLAGKINKIGPTGCELAAAAAA